MSEQDHREQMLRSLDRIRATASRLETQLVELQNIVRFDHRSSGAAHRAQAVESELTQLAAALRHFREHFAEEPVPR